jgi:hypothetical protein
VTVSILFTIIWLYLAKIRPKKKGRQATFLKLGTFCKSDSIVFLLTTESFYYIFLRGNTEKAEISGFMGGGTPVFSKRQRTSFFLSRLYLADNSSSVEMNTLTFLDEGTKLVIIFKNPLY